MRFIAACAAGAALLGVAGAGAMTSPASADTHSTRFVLTRMDSTGSISIGRLSCFPPGGTHPAARYACRELAKVGGRFEKLNVDPGRICTKEYDPVTVAAIGRWRGRPVAYRHIFGNACELEGKTGPVFAY